MSLTLVPDAVRFGVGVERALAARRAAVRAYNRGAGVSLLEAPGMQPVLRTAARLAGAAGAPIIIEGELGTGVADLAHLIHDQDPAARGASFRAIPADVVGRPDARPRAARGTLFIEDIENLRPVGQAWLAEILGDRGAAPRPLRIVAGSQLDVDQLLQQRQISPELVLMLDVGRIVIPPLRRRTGDILVLAYRFLAQCGGALGRAGLSFTPAAEQKLLAHRYPGNVRELRNVIERAVAIETTERIEAESIVFHSQISGASAEGDASEVTREAMAAVRSNDDPRRLPTLSEIERDYLMTLIRKLGGRRTAIARAMGVSYPTVLKKIAHHGIDVRAILASSDGG